jgi:hypothetical protein
LIDEDLAKSVMKTGFALLEANNSKVADYKALIFDLL